MKTIGFAILLIPPLLGLLALGAYLGISLNLGEIVCLGGGLFVVVGLVRVGKVIGTRAEAKLNERKPYPQATGSEPRDEGPTRELFPN